MLNTRSKTTKVVLIEVGNLLFFFCSKSCEASLANMPNKIKWKKTVRLPLAIEIKPIPQ